MNILNHLISTKATANRYNDEIWHKVEMIGVQFPYSHISRWCNSRFLLNNKRSQQAIERTDHITNLWTKMNELFVFVMKNTSQQSKPMCMSPDWQRTSLSRLWKRESAIDAIWNERDVAETRDIHTNYIRIWPRQYQHTITRTLIEIWTFEQKLQNCIPSMWPHYQSSSTTRPRWVWSNTEKRW